MTVCTSLSTQTALYSPLDIEYAQKLSGPYEDLSVHEDNCNVIAGLKDNHISGFWRPVVAAGDDKAVRKEMKRLYEISPNITYMDFLKDGKLSGASKFLLDQGYKASPIYSQIIDLTKPKKQLHANLRKSYKSLVSKQHIISLMNDIAPLYRLHASVRGITRPFETWEIQQRMIWKKQAFVLTQAVFLNRRVPTTANTVIQAGVCVYYNENSAYYACGCSFDGIDSHAILWSAIMHARKIGCKTFEMGEVYNMNDTKSAGISKFKAGFGGETQTRLILERKKNG